MAGVLGAAAGAALEEDDELELPAAFAAFGELRPACSAVRFSCSCRARSAISCSQRKQSREKSAKKKWEATVRVPDALGAPSLAARALQTPLIQLAITSKRALTNAFVFDFLESGQLLFAFLLVLELLLPLDVLIIPHFRRLRSKASSKRAVTAKRRNASVYRSCKKTESPKAFELARENPRNPKV